MSLKLYDTDLSNILLERDYPHINSLSEGGIRECHTEFELPIGQASYHEISFDDIHISYGHAALCDKILLNFETDFETVEMHFALKGNSSVISKDFPQQVNFKSYQNNIVYANEVRGEMQWGSPDFQLFEINLSPQFFKRFLPTEYFVFDAFRNTMDKKDSNIMMPSNITINLQMYQVIEEIMNCKRRGAFKKIFLEAKVIELLLLQLEHLYDDNSKTSSLGRKDIEKMYAVREFMMQNIDGNSSLINLAHQVGTNDFTLKKGFKELFGTTVFGFWNSIKMEQAKKMLLEQDISITEVSENIGYKNPRHFSSAFKKKYGITPSQVKNN